MLKIKLFNLKDLASVLMIYPLSVITFKLFGISLDVKITYLIILLVLSSLKLFEKSRLQALIFSISLYIYILSFVISNMVSASVYISVSGSVIRNIIYENVSIRPLELIDTFNLVFEKSLIYILCLILIYILIVILNNIVSKYFNVYLVGSILYIIFAWFTYVDVESLIVIYILGVLLYYAKNEKTRYIIPIFIVMIVLLNISNSLISYDYINEKLNNVAPKVLIVRSDYRDVESFFRFESSIYYPLDSKLGGTVLLDSNNVVMSVITAEDILYLRGRVKDSYDGLKWVSSHNDYEIFKSSKRYNEKKFYSNNLKSAFIKYKGINSLSVFSPIGFLEYSLDESKLRVNSDSNVYYKSSLFEENINEYRVVFTGSDSLIINDEDYLQLAESITDRTVDLAYKITEGIDDDYEKVLAIKKYLSLNYPYSLEISGDENYTDFVDEFLFEEKKGYCTYYASALSILSRINKIRTRYVEGYLVSPNSYEDGEYLVREDRAHAWTEVYIKEKGWIIVEATPIYDFDQAEIESVRIKKTNKIENTNESLALEETNVKLKEENLYNGKKYNFEPLYMLLIVAVIILAFILKYRKSKLTNKQIALELIYKIDDVLTSRYKKTNGKNQTVYFKMYLYDNEIKGRNHNGTNLLEQNNDIMKDVQQILYNKKNVTSDDLVNLKAYLKYIKK